MQHIMMFPDDNEPIVNRHYEEMAETYKTMLAEAQESLETAAPEDVKDIQSSIDNYQEYLSNMEDYYWEASTESIAAYRELAQYAYAITPTLLTYGGNNEAAQEIQSLISRYLQKQMTMDQFITQMDQKLRMIRLEQE
jgi:ADP-heptose:LPS heptosyltransferase